MGGPGGSGEGIETLPDPSGPSGARSPKAANSENYLVRKQNLPKAHDKNQPPYARHTEVDWFYSALSA